LQEKETLARFDQLTATMAAPNKAYSKDDITANMDMVQDKRDS
jgi:hypothetical protein